MVVKGEKINNPLCNHCNLELKEFVWAFSYWRPHLQFRVHKDCKDQHMREERIACQKIDKSCNDCKFFLSDNKKYNGYRKGKCMSKNIERIAWSNTPYDDTEDCFLHRED